MTTYYDRYLQSPEASALRQAYAAAGPNPADYSLQTFDEYGSPLYLNGTSVYDPSTYQPPDPYAGNIGNPQTIEEAANQGYFVSRDADVIDRLRGYFTSAGKTDTDLLSAAKSALAQHQSQTGQSYTTGTGIGSIDDEIARIAGVDLGGFDFTSLPGLSNAAADARGSADALQAHGGNMGFGTGNIFSDVLNSEANKFQRDSRILRDHPEQQLTGMYTPFQTNMANKLFGTNYKPITSNTSAYNAEDASSFRARGGDPMADQLAHMIAGATVGGALSSGISGNAPTLSGESGAGTLSGNPSGDTLPGGDGGAMDMYGVNNPPQGDVYAGDTVFPTEAETSPPPSDAPLSQAENADVSPPAEKPLPASNQQLDEAIRSGQPNADPEPDKGILAKLGDWTGMGESGTKLAIAGALALAQAQANKKRNSQSQQSLQNVQNQQYPGFNIALQPGKGIQFTNPNYNPFFTMGMSGAVGSPDSKYVGPQSVPTFFSRQARGGLAGVGAQRPLHTRNVGPLSSQALVKGPGGGQDDTIPAALSDGEYVMDADTVSALGDGSNDAGAKKLDAMRENVRRHKRAASPKKIPPKAKAPEQYLRGGV